MHSERCRSYVQKGGTAVVPQCGMPLKNASAFIRVYWGHGKETHLTQRKSSRSLQGIAGSVEQVQGSERAGSVNVSCDII